MLHIITSLISLARQSAHTTKTVFLELGAPPLLNMNGALPVKSQQQHQKRSRQLCGCIASAADLDR